MKPFLWHTRVYYEDTDAGGVVYYANYLKYMERARTEWLRALGVEQDVLIKELNVLFAVRSVTIEYKKPARFNDALAVSVETHVLKPASITFKQDVSQQGDETNLFTTSEVNVVCLNASDFSPNPIPKNLYKVIQSGEV
ncbi:MAG: tol-pal system-associated acyl-CoA thioesterase [Gammaproteobacteria bacterium]|nr:MAG: tol-pal system-associated acyl-CoA thioesterase [Gammaproteobacteria bacterium]